MSKILVLLLVIGVALWWLGGRRRSPPDAGSGRQAPSPKQAEPQPMLACVHCGVHLPRDEAFCDAAGRPFCSEAHRLKGPLHP